MKKRNFTPEYKAKIVLEILKEEKQLNEIAVKESINPNQLRSWRKEFLENAPSVFSGNKDEHEQKQKAADLQGERQELTAKVGQLTIEVDWLKKNQLKSLGLNTKKSLVSVRSEITISRQCKLLGFNRTSFYYIPMKRRTELEESIKRRLDYWHTKMCYLGVRRLKVKLLSDGLKVGQKLIRRYLDEMGNSFCNSVPLYYATNIRDWHSRYIVGWALAACIPEIYNEGK